VFAGRIAVVTGGASGIGRALGTELFRLGAHVILADVDGSDAESVAQEQTAASSTGTGSIVGAQLDVRDGAAFRAVIDETIDRHGRLDLLFNNAGISMGGQTHDMDLAHWDRIIDVNIRGVVNGVQAAYPRMLAQGQGHIVNTASGAGLAPAPLTVAYTTTKYAVVGLSTCLRPEAAAHGVRVSVLCPGPVDTPILDGGPPADLPPRAEPMTGRAYLKKLGFSPMPVDQFAQPALRGVARNKAIIVVPQRAKALWYLQRISPALTESVGRFMVRRVLKGIDSTLREPDAVSSSRSAR
jgi:NAD(P)-dependent dehydrogenase (short-subunit alcohol dehydrogenase family)